MGPPVRRSRCTQSRRRRRSSSGSFWLVVFCLVRWGRCTIGGASETSRTPILIPPTVHHVIQCIDLCLEHFCATNVVTHELTVPPPPSASRNTVSERDTTGCDAAQSSTLAPSYHHSVLRKGVSRTGCPIGCRSEVLTDPDRKWALRHCCFGKRPGACRTLSLCPAILFGPQNPGPARMCGNKTLPYVCSLRNTIHVQ